MTLTTSGAGDGTPAAGTGYDLLRRALLDCEAEHRTGVLRVSGEPGGQVYLTDGAVIAIDTPGAPGPDLILVRSGRISEPAWTGAFTAAAGSGRLGAELVERGLIGAGELDAVLRVTLADEMFAMASGQADKCQLEESATTALLPLEPPAGPGWLLSETLRRIRVLAAAPRPVRHDQDRVTADPDATAVGVVLPDGQDEIIALANGRRTARDMAFIVGRGVYSLSLELTRMQAAGLVAVTSKRSIRPVKSADAGTPATDDGGDGGRPELPRRQQAGRQPRPGPAEVMAPANAALHRLRRLFPVGDRDGGGPVDAEAGS
jgi:hypothetical protein